MKHLAALLAVATLVIACGDEPDENERVTAAIREYLTAVYKDTDFRAACARLAPAVHRRLVAEWRRQVPHDRRPGCAGVFTGLLLYGSLDRASRGVVDPDRLGAATDALPEPPVSEVRVTGDTAEATVAGSRTPVRLRKLDGNWKIETVHLD